jgi:hypothetical protein
VTRFAEALGALDRAGITYRLRKHDPNATLPEQGELDLWMAGSDLARGSMCLDHEGFHPLAARGQEGHSFFLGFDRGHWLKLDVKLDRGPEAPARRDRRPRWIRRAIGALPVSPRRTGRP